MIGIIIFILSVGIGYLCGWIHGNISGQVKGWDRGVKFNGKDID